MIKIEHLETSGWEAAIRGMRNPRNSHEDMDSALCAHRDCGQCPMHEDILEGADCKVDTKAQYYYILGPNDEALMRKLIKRGRIHAKFRRMISVWADITAPLYWWPDYDIYKISNVTNSEGRLDHFLKKPFERSDFSLDAIDRKCEDQLLDQTIELLNERREWYLRNKNKENLTAIYAQLPPSFLQKKTISINYEVLANMYPDRKNHVLPEWREFCRVMKEELPYSWIFTGEETE